MQQTLPDLRSYIKDIPDFPKKGIIFKDITPLLSHPDAFARMIDDMSRPFENKGVSIVAGIESRGFLLATPIAYRLKAGVAMIRKKGKLPRKTISVTYDLEYGQDTLEMHSDAFAPGTKVLLVDDVLATGGTALAASELIEKLDGRLMGMSFLLELGALGGRNKVNEQSIHALIAY